MTAFVDRVVLHVAAGNGGDGCSSIHREKFKPLGGPDGGNGGRGGDVVLVAASNVSSLLDYHHAPHRSAGNGRQGQGSLRHGADGDDVVLRVPVGTVVRSPDGEVIADLVGSGTRYVLAHGGHGGLGNAALATTRRKAPGFALLGEPGERGDFVLEIKSIADVALVGYPSAGKSSLIAAMSAAKPKIADYPFTTLVPNLGVVEAGGHVYTMADVPGLIPGASLGKGLGHEFLRHIERCAVVVHVVDCATLEPNRDPISDLDVIRSELASYEENVSTGEWHEYGRLTERPTIVVLNKVDVPEARELAELVAPELRERGLRVFMVSAASHDGLRALGYALGELVDQARAERPEPEPERIVLRPQPVNEIAFRVVREGDQFRVVGNKPLRWVRQTDFGNDEAVGYLADRLARLGVEDALREAGARQGDTVAIGEGDDAVLFDWEPTVATGAELLHGPRGTDSRLDGR